MLMLLNYSNYEMLGSPQPWLTPTRLKIILAISLFVLSLCSAFLPLKFLALARNGPTGQRRTYQKVISLLSCFAGGVFLGACFLDLFPEVKETMEEAMDGLGVSTKFPLPEFVMIYGLFVVLIAEQIVVYYQERGISTAIAGHGHSHGGAGGGRDVRHSTRNSIVHRPVDADIIEEEENVSVVEPEKSPLIAASCSTRGGYGSLPADQQRPSTSQECPQKINDLRPYQQTAQESGSLDYSHAHANHHAEQTETIPHHHHHHHHHNEQLSDRHNALRAVLLLLALSLHSLFEGLALGLQSNQNDIVQIFSALTAHKLVMAFSLGLNLVQSDLSLRTIICSVIFFCSTSPIAAAIGIVVSESNQTPSATLVSGTLQGLAAGTFLYVTFFEVLPHEMNSGGDRLIKVLCIVLGFSFIAAMIMLLPD